MNLENQSLGQAMTFEEKMRIARQKREALSAASSDNSQSVPLPVRNNEAQFRGQNQEKVRQLFTENAVNFSEADLFAIKESLQSYGLAHAIKISSAAATKDAYLQCIKDLANPEMKGSASDEGLHSLSEAQKNRIVHNLQLISTAIEYPVVETSTPPEPLTTTIEKVVDEKLPEIDPALVRLKALVDTPVTEAEVPNKEAFMRNVFPWVVNALGEAGYDSQGIDAFLKKSIDQLNFKAPAEEYIADINRIIGNIWVQVMAEKNKSVPEVHSASETSASLSAREVRPVVPIVPITPIVPIIPKSELGASTMLTPEPVEPLVLKNPLPKPLILTNQQRVLDTLTLTPEMRVNQVSELLPSEPVKPSEAYDEVRQEKLDGSSEYQNKLDALNTQPFVREAYVEYVFDLHTGLREKYDEVVSSARKNLKRFDGFYAPSTIEKQALQFLSSLQGHYAKMQKADSEIGLIRSELINSLNYTDGRTSETDVKGLAQNYLDATKKLFANINKLEGLVEVVKTEEKPSVAEIYRAQFDTLQTEGNKVLQSLPNTHPLYDRLKVAIESDLSQLIARAAKENGGDTAVLEQSSSFMARRDQIKELISFVKKEQEYQDFFERARSRMQKLESEFKTIFTTAESAGVLKTIEENFQKIKQALHDTTSQIATVGVLENLQKHKDTVQGLLLESSELVTSLPHAETLLQEPGVAPLLSDTEAIAILNTASFEQEIIPTQVQQVENKTSVPLVSYFNNPKREQELQAIESHSSGERIKNIVSKIPLAKIGKAAMVALSVLWSSGPLNQKSEVEILNGPLMSSSALTPPEISFDAIQDFLRMAPVDAATYTSSPIKISSRLSNDASPLVSESSPKLSTLSVTEETVPGVIFSDQPQRIQNEVSELPLEIFSDDADSVPYDSGIVFESPAKIDGAKKLEKYLLAVGDVFWDINEGQTLAGKLPVMSQINPYFKQALIDRVRDKINSDSAVRKAIGGFGTDPTKPFANQLRAGEYMDLEVLNELAISIAIEYGYLK